MVSSARNAPSPTVVIFGSRRTVDASTFFPTLAPSSLSASLASIFDKGLLLALLEA